LNNVKLTNTNLAYATFPLTLTSPEVTGISDNTLINTELLPEPTEPSMKKKFDIMVNLKFVCFNYIDLLPTITMSSPGLTLNVNLFRVGSTCSSGVYHDATILSIQTPLSCGLFGKLILLM